MCIFDIPFPNEEWFTKHSLLALSFERNLTEQFTLNIIICNTIIGQEKLNSWKSKETPYDSQGITQTPTLSNTQFKLADSKRVSQKDHQRVCSSVHLQGLDKLVSSAFDDNLPSAKSRTSDRNIVSNVFFPRDIPHGYVDLSSKTVSSSSSTCKSNQHEVRVDSCNVFKEQSCLGKMSRDINKQPTGQVSSVLQTPMEETFPVHFSKSSIGLINDLLNRFDEETPCAPHCMVSQIPSHPKSVSSMSPANSFSNKQATSQTHDTVKQIRLHDCSENYVLDNLSPDAAPRNTSSVPNDLSGCAMEAGCSFTQQSSVCMESPYQRYQPSSACSESFGAISSMERMIDQFPPVATYSKKYKPLRPHPGDCELLVTSISKCAAGG